MITTISKGQQLTIPASMRELIGLDAGVKVDITLEDDRIIITPIGEDIEEVFKRSKRITPKKKMSAEQMDELNEEMFR